MSVILKGEVHVSPYDQQEAKDLIAEENLNVMLLEGKDDQGFEWDSWLSAPLLLIYPVIQLMYMDHSWLEDLAEAKGIKVERTRGSDNSLWANAHWMSKILAYTAFVTLLPLGLILGAGGLLTLGFSSVILGCVLPIVIPRYSNMMFNEHGNPDKRIAKQISEHQDKDKSVLAIIGNCHLRGVKRELDGEEISYTCYPTKHSLWNHGANAWIVWKMTASITAAYLIFYVITRILAILLV